MAGTRLMRTSLIQGILLVVVPLLVVGGVAFYLFQIPKPTAVASLNKGFGITFDHPPPNFFDRNSQLMVGLGLCLASICWGAAKVISALRGNS